MSKVVGRSQQKKEIKVDISNPDSAKTGRFQQNKEIKLGVTMLRR